MKTTKFSSIALSLALAPTLFALPSGEQIQHGNAQFSQNGNELQITSTDGTIINWQNFDIAKDEIVKILQNHDNAQILNRVLDGQMTRIEGLLRSNANVFLINTSGIFIGAGAKIDTKGFTASTLDIKNEDFINKNLNFTGSGGVVENQGIIIANGGKITLIGEQIKNSGTLKTTENGEIYLLAGHKAVIKDLKNGTVEFELEAPRGEVLNLGKILTESGNINLNGAEILISNEIKANGGEINIGSRGVTKILSTDHSTNISSNSDEKQGGEIRLWADKAIYKGKYAATSKRAKGGFIETSAEVLHIDDAISVDTRGKSSGEWLIDPRNIEIVGESDASASATLTTNNPATIPNGGDTKIKASVIKTQLETTSVTLDATVGQGGNGDITFKSDARLEATEGNTNDLNLKFLGTLKFESGSVVDLKGGALNAVRDKPRQASPNRKIILQGTTIKVGKNSVLEYGDHITLTGDNVLETKSNDIELKFKQDLIYGIDGGSGAAQVAKHNVRNNLAGNLTVSGNVKFESDNSSADMVAEGKKRQSYQGAPAHGVNNNTPFVWNIDTFTLQNDSKFTFKKHQQLLVDSFVMLTFNKSNFTLGEGADLTFDVFASTHYGEDSLSTNAMVFKGDINANRINESIIDSSKKSTVNFISQNRNSDMIGNGLRSNGIKFDVDNMRINANGTNINFNAGETNNEVAPIQFKDNVNLTLDAKTEKSSINLEIDKSIRTRIVNGVNVLGTTIDYLTITGSGNTNIKAKNAYNKDHPLWLKRVVKNGTGAATIAGTLVEIGNPGAQGNSLTLNDGKLKITTNGDDINGYDPGGGQKNFKSIGLSETMHIAAGKTLEIVNDFETGKRSKIKLTDNTTIDNKGNLIISNSTAENSTGFELEGKRFTISGGNTLINSQSPYIPIRVANGGSINLQNNANVILNLSGVNGQANPVENENKLGRINLSGRSKLEIASGKAFEENGNSSLNNFAFVSQDLKDKINASSKANLKLNENITLTGEGNSLSIKTDSLTSTSGAKISSDNPNNNVDLKAVSLNTLNVDNISASNLNVTVGSTAGNLNFSNLGNNANLKINATDKNIDGTAKTNPTTIGGTITASTSQIPQAGNPVNTDDDASVTINGNGQNLKVTAAVKNAKDITLTTTGEGTIDLGSADTIATNADLESSNKITVNAKTVNVNQNLKTKNLSVEADTVNLNHNLDSGDTKISTKNNLSVAQGRNIQADGKLTLESEGDTTINGTLSADSMELKSGGTLGLTTQINTNGGVSIEAVNADIQNTITSGGETKITAIENANITANITSTGGDTTISANGGKINATVKGQNVTVASKTPINSEGLTLNATNGDLNLNAGLSSSGAVSLTATGETNVNKAVTTTGENSAVTITGNAATKINANVTSTGETHIGKDGSATTIAAGATVISTGALEVKASTLNLNGAVSSDATASINATTATITGNITSTGDTTITTTGETTISSTVEGKNVTLTSTNAVSSDGLTINATGGDLTLDAEINSGGNVILAAKRDSKINKSVTTTQDTANVTITADNDAKIDAVVSSAGITTITGKHETNINQAIASAGETTITGGNVNLNQKVTASGVNIDSTTATINTKPVAGNLNLKTTETLDLKDNNLEANNITLKVGGVATENETLKISAKNKLKVEGSVKTDKNLALSGAEATINASVGAKNITIDAKRVDSSGLQLDTDGDLELNGEMTSTGKTSIKAANAKFNAKVQADELDIQTTESATVGGELTANRTNIKSGGKLAINASVASTTLDLSGDEVEFAGGNVAGKSVNVSGGTVSFRGKTGFDLQDPSDPNKKPNINANTIIGAREGLVTKDTEINNAKEDAQAQTQGVESTTVSAGDVLNESVGVKTSEKELGEPSAQISLELNGQDVRDLISDKVLDAIDFGKEIVLNLANARDLNQNGRESDESENLKTRDAKEASERALEIKQSGKSEVEIKEENRGDVPSRTRQDQENEQE